jgi:two-component system, LytTR family, response regulator
MVLKRIEEPASKNKNDAFFFIRENNHFVKIETNKVLYLKALENYTQIITLDQCYTTLLTLSNVEEQLPKTQFQRVHRSYIVNLLQVSSVNTTDIFINDIQIPLSHKFSEKVIDKLVKGHLLTKGSYQ